MTNPALNSASEIPEALESKTYLESKIIGNLPSRSSEYSRLYHKSNPALRKAEIKCMLGSIIVGFIIILELVIMAFSTLFGIRCTDIIDFVGRTSLLVSIFLGIEWFRVFMLREFPYKIFDRERSKHDEMKLKSLDKNNQREISNQTNEHAHGDKEMKTLTSNLDENESHAKFASRVKINRMNNNGVVDKNQSTSKSAHPVETYIGNNTVHSQLINVVNVTNSESVTGAKSKSPRILEKASRTLSIVDPYFNLGKLRERRPLLRVYNNSDSNMIPLGISSADLENQLNLTKKNNSNQNGISPSSEFSTDKGKKNGVEITSAIVHETNAEAIVGDVASNHDDNAPTSKCACFGRKGRQDEVDSTLEKSARTADNSAHLNERTSNPPSQINEQDTEEKIVSNQDDEAKISTGSSASSHDVDVANLKPPKCKICIRAFWRMVKNLIYTLIAMALYGLIINILLDAYKWVPQEYKLSSTHSKKQKVLFYTVRTNSSATSQNMLCPQSSLFIALVHLMLNCAIMMAYTLYILFIDLVARLISMFTAKS